MWHFLCPLDSKVGKSAQRPGFPLKARPYVLQNAGMVKRSRSSAWSKTFSRSLVKMTQRTLRLSRQALSTALPRAPKASKARRATAAPASRGDWSSGAVVGTTGTRRFHLYCPPDLVPDELLPLMVMLHGCGQDAQSFALSTRMNQLAARERFLVLYPEQDRLAHARGCWNWYDTRSGRAYAEAALILKAVDRVCLRHPVDPARVAIAGLSAGGSMAALIATRHPGRFRAVAMHSGIPPGRADSTLSALGAMNGHRVSNNRQVATLPLVAQTHCWPPLLVIHGRADAVVAPSNGRAAVDLWAQATGALACPTRELQRGKRYPVSVTEFKRQGHLVGTLMEVSRLGHAWSGGAAQQAFSDGLGPDASRMVWAFAAKQFRAVAPGPVHTTQARCV